MPRVNLPILDGSYPSNFKVQSVQQLLNFYLEEDVTQERFIAIGTPGFTEWQNLTGSEVRGLIEHRGVGYAVVDDKIYKITSQFASSSLGTINTTTGRVSIAAIEDEIGFADGADVWIYSISGNTLTQVVDADLPANPEELEAINEFFVVSDLTDNVVQVSDLADGTSWNALSFFSADTYPDKIVALKKLNTNLWCFCERSTEIFYISGGPTVPFDRAVSGAIPYGCAAQFSVAVVNDNLFWLAQNENGLLGVMRASGDDAEIVSNRGMVTEFIGYNSLSDAFAWTYQENGHVFYIITFPNTETIDGVDHGKTWAYDLTTQKWSEWKSIFTDSVVDPGYSRHRANAHMYFGTSHIIGDYESGKLYKLDSNTYTEDGTSIRRSITTKHFVDRDTFITMQNLVIETESGSGLEGTAQGSDPEIILRYSKNRGRTWSSYINRKTGKLGEYRQRATWNRIGSGRTITLELSVTDPIRWVILGATALVSLEEPQQ